MSSHEPLHILLFPFMAPGHMIPMLDLAKLFSLHGLNTTILSTPANAPHFQPSIHAANADAGDRRPRITLHLLPFPVEQVGLPKGLEDASKLTSDLTGKFFAATDLLHQPFGRALDELRPDAVVTDMFFPWTLDIATDRGIPRLVFHGTSNFSIAVTHLKRQHKVVESLPADAERFVVPCLPHRIEFLKSQEPDKEWTVGMTNMFDKFRESEIKSYGVVMNSFHELEPEYVELYRNVLGVRTWNVGPVCLCNNDDTAKFQRGKAAVINAETCLNWLSKKDPNSVIYISFGSVSPIYRAQLREIALGLESYGGNFIWVVREPKTGDTNWLPEGFEERIVSEDKGLIIRGWAPQMLILSHPSVGGFMTHCGWNSSLEGISAGLPFVTWPMFAEQFYNEKFIVQVIETGVSIGCGKYVQRTNEEDEAKRELVRAEEIAEKVSWLMMGGSEEAEEMKRKARAIGEAAKKAVEVGGSSYVEMSELIDKLNDRKCSSKAS